MEPVGEQNQHLEDEGAPPDNFLPGATVDAAVRPVPPVSPGLPEFAARVFGEVRHQAPLEFVEDEVLLVVLLEPDDAVYLAIAHMQGMTVNSSKSPAADLKI